MIIGVVGLGLIGGSIALDLRRLGVATHLVGYDNNAAHTTQALELNIVDEIIPSYTAFDVDVIILSIPVNYTSQLLPQLLSSISENVVVIDTGSTKKRICDSVTTHSNRAQYVAAHPIAGTEFSGPAAAVHNLFQGKTNIICEPDKSSQAALNRATAIFESLGMRTVFMNAMEHDKHLAYVSHLSHVSSFLLGHTVLDIEKDEKSIFELAGSGFASTVRLAKSSPEMWAPIFEHNKDFLSQALHEYIIHLQKFHYHLIKNDTEELYKILKQSNEIRRILKN